MQVGAFTPTPRKSKSNHHDHERTFLQPWKTFAFGVSSTPIDVRFTREELHERVNMMLRSIEIIAKQTRAG